MLLVSYAKHKDSFFLLTLTQLCSADTVIPFQDLLHLLAQLRRQRREQPLFMGSPCVTRTRVNQRHGAYGTNWARAMVSLASVSATILRYEHEPIG